MTADDERAQKIAEAKARAEAARRARMGGQAAQPAAEPPAAEAPAEAPEEAEPAAAAAETVVAQAAPAPAPAEPAAAPAAGADGADDREARIAAAKARAEAARAAREGGAVPAQPAAQAAAAAAPAAASAEAAPGGATAADERQRRIEEAKARAAAARSGGGAAAPAQPAAAAATPAAAAPAAPARAAATAAPPAPMAPSEDWRGTAVAPNRVLTVRAEPRAMMRRELRDQEKRNLYTRRSIVRTSFWAALAVTLAGFALGFVNFFWPRKVVGFGGVVKIPASQVPAAGADPKRFPEGKLYLVNLKPGEGVPAEFQALAQPSQNGGLLALWQKCPHLGCTVPWRPEFEFEGVKGWFRCPCHGSTYTKAGVRVFGPAPRPMDTFAVKINGDGSVDVDTSKRTPGAPDNPQRAVLA